MSASHARARRLDGLTTGLSLAIAGAGVVGTFVVAVATPVNVIGALWALAYSTGAARWAGAELQRAATIQESLDVALFDLPWNSVLVGEPVGAPEISRLNARYRGRDDMIYNYYEIRDFPPPYDVLACQMMNLGWGARVRRRFAQVLLTLVICWAGAGVLVGALTAVTVAHLLLTWYVPSLGGLMLGLDLIRRQYGVVNERNRVLQLLRTTAMASTQADHPHTDEHLRALARQVQDAIFLTRVSCPRVPDWFFFQRRKSDRLDFAADMDELGLVIARRGRSTARPTREDAGHEQA